MEKQKIVKVKALSEKVIDCIEKWNGERGLLDKEWDLDREIRMLREELQEFNDAKSDEEEIDALGDGIVVATGSILKLGARPEGRIQKELIIEKNSGDIAEWLESILDVLERNTEGKKHIVEMLNLYIEELIYAIAVIGYKVNDVMFEICREISSRTGSINPKTGKFEKDLSEEAKSRWHKASFEHCKI